MLNMCTQTMSSGIRESLRLNTSFEVMNRTKSLDHERISRNYFHSARIGDKKLSLASDTQMSASKFAVDQTSPLKHLRNSAIYQNGKYFTSRNSSKEMLPVVEEQEFRQSNTFQSQSKDKKINFFKCNSSISEEESKSQLSSPNKRSNNSLDQ